MTAKEVSRIEVQLLRSTKGDVIFMEVDSDFVELLFKIMKSPIAELWRMNMKSHTTRC